MIGATIKQLKSYAELVAELEQGLDSFKAKCVNTESVAQYMRDAFPGPDGQSVVAEDATYDHATYQAIIDRVGPVPSLSDPGDGVNTFSAEDVKAIENACRGQLNKAAEGSFEQLRILLQMGYARVVFTNGRVRSKLTFDVSTSDLHQRTSSDLAQSAFRASAQTGGILGAILGVSGSMSASSLRVRTVNEKTVEADKVHADIMGEVEVNFATQPYILYN